jgi:putative ABC transport system ATP-binding protein
MLMRSLDEHDATRDAPAESAPSAGESPAVLARDVCKTYHTYGVAVRALSDINLTVARGEMLAVMGPSGSGKTTLLNCLAGLDVVDCGSVQIRGVDLAALTDGERTDFRARTMGFMFQSFNLLPVLSAVENVELPLLVLRHPPRQAREQAREQLAAVGLAARERHRPAELSGGQQQRVAIARAIITQPAIVWADEPTGNLDSEASEEVLALLRELNRTLEQTLVLVTHAPDVAAHADRLIRMRDGRIVGDSAPSPRAAS